MSIKPVAAPVEPQPLKNYKLRAKVNCFLLSTIIEAVDESSAYREGCKQLRKALGKKGSARIQILSAEELA